MTDVFGFRRQSDAQGILRMYQAWQNAGEKIAIPKVAAGNMVFWEGTLQADLEPATSRTTGFKSANFKFLKLDPDNAGKAYLTQSNYQETCINRDPYRVYFSGEYVSGIIQHGRYVVLWPDRRALYGKADANIASTSSGTVSLYETSSTDSTLNLTSVYNITDQQADLGAWVEVTPMEAWSKWILKPVECPA